MLPRHLPHHLADLSRLRILHRRRVDKVFRDFQFTGADDVFQDPFPGGENEWRVVRAAEVRRDLGGRVGEGEVVWEVGEGAGYGEVFGVVLEL